MQNRKGIVRILVFVLFLYALFRFAQARQALSALERTAAELERERCALEREHAALERRLAQRDSPEQMEALARQELGMVMPGEIVFTFAEAAD